MAWDSGTYRRDASKANRGKPFEDFINFYNQVVTDYNAGYELQEPFAPHNIVRQLEKDVLLKVVDSKWIDHLHNIDMLRDGIGLRAYGQKDPLIEYKKEAYDMFNNMMYEIQSDTVKHLFRTKFGVQVVNNQPEEPVDVPNEEQEEG